MTGSRLRIAVLCPHFAPDTAPTGHVMTRIVAELVDLGHEVHVVTSLPWYRAHSVESGWEARWFRREVTEWGSITRVNPFSGGDRKNLARRAAGFVAFSAIAGVASLRGGRVDAVITMSPPLTMGLTGWMTHLVRRGPLVFNIQDVFPDAAVETGAITNRSVISAARWLERVSYNRAAAVTVLSNDLRENVAAKLEPAKRSCVRVIPNFVDTEAIRPGDRMTTFRRELGIADETVVMYAGNVGYSQSLEMVVDAAKMLPSLVFVINGDGAALTSLKERAAGLANVRFSGYQPADRLAEVLATADVHLVPLKAGLGRVSVPSKTYSILAAGRPVLAAIDAGTEVPRILKESGAGVCVPPDDAVEFVAAVRAMAGDDEGRAQMSRAGRLWVEHAASPRAVAEAYADLIIELNGRS
ncbi:MAG TPA: glycosyltransferase family 4 protein [Ilumatobacteraceae bacterium]|jgi:colanic acid biosynthesis glycosyl transferase WcaI